MNLARYQTQEEHDEWREEAERLYDIYEECLLDWARMIIGDTSDEENPHSGNTNSYWRARQAASLDYYNHLQHEPVVQRHREVSSDLRYFITFTTKPDVSFSKVQECFQKFLSRHEALGLKFVAYSEEHVTSNAHIHAYVESSKTLKMSHFKNYERYGRINKQRCKGTKDECIDYISKENDYESITY